jgi:exodeoxyribonuclease V gamma subunit
VGTLGGLHDRTLLRVEYSRLAPKHRIRAWVRLVALAASTGEPWRAATLGRGQRQGLSSAIAGPLEQGAALAALVDLVALRDEGLCEPLPLPTVTAYTYARDRCGGADPDAAADEAMKKWTTGAGAERADDAHQRVWGPSAGREVLMAAPGPPGGEPSRFGTLALTLWAPILLAEDVVRL